MKSSDKTRSTGAGNVLFPLQYYCHENTKNSVERQKYVKPEDDPHRSEGVQYAIGEGKTEGNY